MSFTNPYQNYFPVGYQNPYQATMPPITPTVPPYTPPYSTQGQPTVPQVQQPTTAPNPTPQAMTPPTIHAEIIQVRTVEEADGYPVNTGTTQMFQLADDSAFVTKTVYANGQYNTDIYAKQPKKPAQPAFDPSVYVTREELEERLAGLTARRGRKRQDEEDGAENQP